MTALRHSSTRRWALWAFALALLLKAAMPMLASASASVQGKAVVEVCTVYGVSLVALDDGSAPKPADGGSTDHAGAHSADHCALNALPLLAAFDAPAALPVLSGTAPAPEIRINDGNPPPDASARWVAALHHAPPSHT